MWIRAESKADIKTEKVKEKNTPPPHTRMKIERLKMKIKPPGTNSSQRIRQSHEFKLSYEVKELLEIL